MTSTDHKTVGFLYLITSFGFFVFGGSLAMMMRAELAWPGMQLMTLEQYNQLFTMHGTIMMLLFATPLFAGFANAIMPLQIGAPDVAFPRLNMLSYWLYLFGGLIVCAGFLAPGGAASFGWFAYSPLRRHQHPDPWGRHGALAAALTVVPGVVRSNARPDRTLQVDGAGPTRARHSGRTFRAASAGKRDRTMNGRRTPVPIPRSRRFAGSRLAWGALLLVEPRGIFRAASGSAATTGSATAVCLLGLRDVAQALVTIAAPTRGVLLAGASVDAVHSLSMISLGVVSPRYRRAALVSATSATAACVAGVMLARQGAANRPACR